MTSPTWKQRIGVFAGLSALALLAYVPALDGGLLWDDTDWIASGESLRGLRGLARIWLDPSALIQYYPLTYTSWWIDHLLWGLAPLPYHVENVLLHALGAALFWELLRRLGVPGALPAALVFCLHPVHAESVAWLTERKNVLSGVFYLASLNAWVRHLGDGGARAWRWSLLFFALALLAKTATLMLPVVLLILVGWRARADRRAAIRTLPFFALSIAAAGMTVYMEHVAGAVGAEWSLSFAERLVLSGQVVWFYLSKLLVPIGLCFVYTGEGLTEVSLTGFIPLLSLPIIAVAAWFLRGSWGAPVLVAGGFFVANLFPVMGFFDLYWMRYAFVGDHFQYLASLGPIALIAALVARSVASHGGPPRYARIGLGLAVLAALGAQTWRQAGQYRDVEILWLETLRRNPDAWLAHTNLGNLISARGDIDDGLPHHERALEINPLAFESLNAVGNHLVREGRFEEALERFQTALGVRPSRALTYYNLGVMELARDREAQALDWFRRGLERNPSNLDLMRYLAELLCSAREASLRDAPQALRLAERVCDRRAAPTAADVHTLTKALAAMGRLEEARLEGHRALELARREGSREREDRIRGFLNRIEERLGR